MFISVHILYIYTSIYLSCFQTVLAYSAFSCVRQQLWHSWPGSSNSISVQCNLLFSQIEIIPLPKPEKELPEPNEEDGELVGEVEGELESRDIESDSVRAFNKKGYSQVIDSSDEENRNDEDEEWCEKPSPSDYEKHFLPIIVDT